MTNTPANTMAPATSSLTKPHQPQRILEWLRSGYALPLLVLAVSLAVTLNIWKHAQQNARQELQSRFDSYVREANAHIEQRMEAYEQVLRGMDGLFAHANSVQRDEFHDYVARLKLAENYPGIHGLGFALVVPKAMKDQHTNTVNKQGFPRYTIKPEGEREIYTPVIYIEPFNEPNQRAFGYDMYSEPARRTAMEQARDSGNAAISGKVKLLMETGSNPQAGFLMYLPIYKSGSRHITLAERRANIIGWIYAPFRMRDLMNGILGERNKEIDIEIYDGGEISDKTLMYDADDNLGGRSGTLFQVITRMEIGGHTWTVAIRSQPALDASLDKKKMNLIAYNGVGISILLTLLIWLLVYSRAQATRMAHAMSKGLIKSESELRSLFDNASEGIWVTDADRRTVKANRALQEILGASEHYLINKSIYDFVDEADFQDSAAKLQESGINQHFEIALKRTDGARIYCQFNTSPMRDENGDITGSFALVTDITGRKKLEMQKEQYFKFFMLSLDMMCIIGADGFLKRVNTAFIKKLGYSEKELLGRPLSEILVADDHPATIREVARQVRGRVTMDFENRYLCKDGSFCWLSWRAFTDTADGLVYATARDITERKRSEEALRASEERFRSVFDYSRAGMVVSDANLNFLRANRAFCEMLGYAEDELLARDIKRITHPGDIEPNLALSNKLLAGEIDFYHLEKRYIRKDGSIIWGDLTVSAVRVGEKKMIYAIAIIQDITQRKQHEEILRELYTAIDQSPVSVVITDTEGNIQYVNPQFTTATGYTAIEAMGQNPRILQSGQTPQETYQDLWGKIRNGQIWHGEMLNKRKNGEVFWEEIHIAPVVNPAGSITHYVCLKSDITERIKSKAAIERISSYYKMLGDMNSANIHARDRDGLFKAACHIAVESVLIRMAWIGLLDPQSGDIFPVAQAGHVDGYLDALQININHGERGNSPTAMAIKSGGKIFCNDISSDPAMRPWRENALVRGYYASIALPLRQKGKVIGVFNLYFQEANVLTADVIQLLDSLVADISFTLDFMAESENRERVQREVRELSAFMETAREDERKHLARELHDELGQTMTALRFDLNWIGSQPETQGGAVGAKILSMKDMVSQTVDVIRRISENLRPGMLDDLGLVAAIENHEIKFSERTGIACDLLISQPDFDLDDQVATTLFRIVQEALTNIARHSGADHASIQLHKLKDSILLIVQDNGCGLPPDRNADKKTYGLLGMRERVKMLGGTLDIFTERGAGVRIEANIPIRVKGNA